MVNKGKLKMALVAEKGVDYKKLHQKKVHKERIKQKSQRSGGRPAPPPKDQDASEDDEEWEDDSEGGAAIEDEDDEDEEDEEAIDLQALNESDTSDSEIEMEAKIDRQPKPKTTILRAKNALTPAKKADDEDDDDEEDEEDIPLSDLEDLDDEDKEDLVAHTRLTINNTSALLGALNRIAIPTDNSVPFATHQCVVGAEPTASAIEDVQDDVQRELAFYNQSLQAAQRARALLKGEGVPFSRPTDYFAEMVKDDGHMAKIKERLVEEASAKKASAEARKQRELKKFGKQVQVKKLQERQKEKRETLEKIQSLKRKRGETGDAGGTHEALDFDVGIDAELNRKASAGAGRRDAANGGPNQKRQKKNEKYGFGGKKKHSKSGDAMSSADMSGFSAKRMKTGVKGKVQKTSRLGKSRRGAIANKKR